MKYNAWLVVVLIGSESVNHDMVVRVPWIHNLGREIGVVDRVRKALRLQAERGVVGVDETVFSLHTAQRVACVKLDPWCIAPQLHFST